MDSLVPLTELAIGFEADYYITSIAINSDRVHFEADYYIKTIVITIDELDIMTFP